VPKSTPATIAIRIPRDRLVRYVLFPGRNR
jgi:hypothetical protein